MLKKETTPLKLSQDEPKVYINRDVKIPDQVIFVIHGYGSNANCMKEISFYLKRNHQKLLGQGKKIYASLEIVSLSHNSHDFMSMVEQCEKQIVRYFSNYHISDFPRKVHLVGISTGALIAIELKCNMKLKNPSFPIGQYHVLINKARLFLINPVIYMNPEQKKFLQTIKTEYLSDKIYDSLTDEPTRECNKRQKLKPSTILQIGKYANNLSSTLSNARYKTWGSVFLFLSTNDTLTLSPKHVYKSFARDVKLMNNNNYVEFYKIDDGKHSSFNKEELNYITSNIINNISPDSRVISTITIDDIFDKNL